MNIAMAGLGAMGRPIAANLHRPGDTFIAVGRRSDVLAELEAQGVDTSSDFDRLTDMELIFLCLPDGRAIRDLLFGERGIARGLGPGQIVIDLGTTDHGDTLLIGDRLGKQGVAFLDAPVSGMAARAVDASLTVMCGGEREVFDRVQPVLERIGNNILFMGPAGSGQLTKLINQLLFDINMAALAEVLPVAAKLGLDPTLVGEVVNGGTGRSFASEFFVPRILRGHFTDGYPMQDAYKDLVGGARLSADLGVPMPVLAAATATYQTALLAGHGSKDKGAMILALEQLLCVAFRDDAGGSGGRT